uniref:YME1 like 1 ATPase n=1 Tax=Scleropages formosus TaxID=113540 RepID=A0A8C9T2F0_SCLFO
MFSFRFFPLPRSRCGPHLINAFHSLKSPKGTSSRQQKEPVLESDLPSCEPTLNLKDLGLADLKEDRLHDLVDQLLPGLVLSRESSGPSPSPRNTGWRISHISTDSFFHNKHGGVLASLGLCRQSPTPLQMVSTGFHHWPVCIQSRGFKTLKSKTKRLQSGYERAADTESFTPSFMKGILMRDKGLDVDSLDKLLKSKNVPEAHHDAFKTGFAEGFLKAQALTQRTQGKISVYNMSCCYVLCKWSIASVLNVRVRFRTTSGLDAGVDPVHLKNVTFEHVKGVEEAKQELQEVVEFLRNPQKFTVLGGKLPKGILLVGPPGTGKTLLARAVAGEADVPFYYASGSEFDEMFVGVGASRIRNLFREAKANSPCVIFIDELDSVGGKRIESPMHPYSRQTINQLLAEMDGFKPNEGVIVIGATNFPEALDNALIRPGRFDMQVTVPKPDVKGRTEILKWYLRKIKVDSEVIARGTVGFSGADLENLVNQAALKAAVDGKDMVTMKELEFAKDKILMGPERRSAEIDQKNKTITAYHESGHAIVAFYTRDAMPINKATIMPRGPTLGHVSMLPENDRWSETRSQLLAQMDVSMGGRVAEELVFGSENITTGASSDFDDATKIARMMVTRFGMSDKLGVMTYSDVSKQSPETQAAVEQEVRTLLKESYERAKHILKTHSKEHKNLAEALLMYETLDAKEIQMVLEGKTLDTR